MSTIRAHHVATFLYLLVAAVSAYLIWDISVTFIHPESSALSISMLEHIPYFIPAFVLILIVRLGWYHERFEGITLILSSFLFLPIYRLSVSLGLFITLFFIGSFFLLDDYRRHLPR